MNLHDWLNQDELSKDIHEGYISMRNHDTLPLTVFNYTAKCQYERYWTPETLACRGLIVDNITAKVIARPFPKFFNYDEVTLGQLMDLGESEPTITLKMDGSLGVMYPGSDGLPHIATRGSFHSDQANWASLWLIDIYPSYIPPPNMTLLFEIIYPANRIVVDYGATEELFLLAVIDNETGADLPLDAANWPGLTVAQMDSYSYADLLRVLPDLHHNEEGFVCQWNQPSQPAFRVKMKGAEYLRLHRLVTGCSNLTVWEHLKDARPFDELLDRVPDEFNKWLKAEISKQTWDHDMLVTSAMKRFNAIMDVVEAGDRKAFALLATKQDHSDLLFALYDGKSIEERAWKKLRPVYARPYTTDDGSG